MNTMTLELDFGILGEQSVTVGYNYTPESGDGWHEPREPEEWELYSVLLHGHEVNDLLSDEETDKIIEAIKENVSYSRYEMGEP